MNTPRMYFAMDSLGGYDGLFDGEHVLASAGVAWRNPGDGFTLGVPDAPASLIVDSGGFQAATRWNGVEACERGLPGRYPYSPAELHEWAESIGADVVAGMDVACEPVADLFDAEGFEKGYVYPGDRRDRALDALDYQVRQAREHDRGGYSHALMPVVQGYRPDEYAEFLDRMDAEGLLAYDHLAIGTVCKRKSLDDILDVVRVVRDRAPEKHLHLFGATLRVWGDRRFDGLYESTDTAAWNWGARDKAHKKELARNYRGRVDELLAARAGEQERLPCGPVAAADGGREGRR